MWTDVIVAVFGAIAGGGLYKLLTIRSTLKKDKTKQRFDDFEAIQEIIQESRAALREHHKEYSQLLDELKIERKARIEYESKYNECVNKNNRNTGNGTPGTP